MEPKKEWHLPINQTGWHLAISADGAYRVRPNTSLPPGMLRIYPGLIGAWKYFEMTGALRSSYKDFPIYENPESQQS